MDNLIKDNISLAIFIPFWIFLIIMGGRFFSVYVNRKLIYALTLFASFLGTIICCHGLKYLTHGIEWSQSFIKINDFTLHFGIHVDRISLITGAVLFGISFVVQLFSVSYMKNEKKNYRFFALLNLFNFAMAALIFSPNLYQLYFFWEIIGIASYLLIGFEYDNNTKSISSKRVFLTNRVGDTALIGGILLTTYIMYNYSGNSAYTTLSIQDFNTISTLLMAYTTTPVFLTVCSLFIVGAMVKSAQFPFHIWLIDAMEAKLPVSALLHSATMVAAGIYLIIRLMPFFALSHILTTILTVIGLITALVCALSASMEVHPKKVLAYSTSANLGLMFIALGLGNVKLAIILLCVHALIKSMLFLALPKEDKLISYADFSIFVIGALSLSGLLFAGMYSKEIFFEFIKNNIMIEIPFLIFTFISAFYILRLAVLIFKNSTMIKNSNITELGANLILLAANIAIYIYFQRFERSLSLPYLFGLIGVILVFIMTKTNSLLTMNKPPEIIANILNTIIPAIYEKFCNFAAAIEKRVFSNYTPIYKLTDLSVKLVYYIEENIMNKSVRLTAEACKAIAKQDLILQSGNIQTYNAYAFILVTIVVTLVIIGYTFIITNVGG